jgi:hypothetical protein
VTADLQSEGFGGLEVDDEFEGCGLLDGQVTGPSTLEDLVDEDSRASA